MQEALEDIRKHIESFETNLYPAADREQEQKLLNTSARQTVKLSKLSKPSNWSRTLASQTFKLSKLSNWYSTSASQTV